MAAHLGPAFPGQWVVNVMVRYRKALATEYQCLLGKARDSTLGGCEYAKFSQSADCISAGKSPNKTEADILR